MQPIVTVAEMRDIDRRFSEGEDVLIARAGRAVSRAAKSMLGGCYGRRVVVVAGPGNNGADGRVAAELLERCGVKVVVVPPGEHKELPRCDLVIDAAYGTGLHGEYDAPDTHGVAVLAVDIPSGVNGDTGEATHGAVKADRTVTFGALKPGHFLGSGPELCGELELVDIGLDTSGVTTHLLEKSDVIKSLPRVERESHKWRTAVAVVAGSPGMMGAAQLVASGAQRAGAGMVRLGSPGVDNRDMLVCEAVSVPIPSSEWCDAVLAMSNRASAFVIGPGIGREDSTVKQTRDVIAKIPVPIVVDADGLYALSIGGTEFLKERDAPTILSPHDGEFARLSGHKPEVQRIEDVRSLARQSNAIVLLKGSTTVVASPDGSVLVTATGGPRLATAGTGDVLSGIIGAFLAQDMEPLVAAGAAAFVHGESAKLGPARGLIASDLPSLVSQWLSL